MLRILRLLKSLVFLNLLSFVKSLSAIIKIDSLNQTRLLILAIKTTCLIAKQLKQIASNINYCSFKTKNSSINK